MKKRFWRLLPLMIFALLTLFLWRGLFLDPQKLPSVQLGQHLPAFRLAVLGSAEKVFTERDIKGKFSLLNVWASWCAACVEEQVFLMQLKDEGVPVYGLNYKDDPKEALRWLALWGNPYQVIGEDRAGRVAIDLGVYGAPETFLVDSKGIIRYRYAGILDASTWSREFLPRIQHWQEKSS